MKKTVFITLSLIFVLVLVSCGSGFDKESAINRSKKVVDVIDSRDYDAMIGQLRQDVQKQSSAESLKSAWDGLLSWAGAFTEYTETSAAVKKDQDSGTQYMAVTLVGRHENYSLTYNIKLDKDNNVVGMFLKKAPEVSASPSSQSTAQPSQSPSA